MTNNRFQIKVNSNIEWIMQNELLLPITDNGRDLTLKNVVDLLNKLTNENKQLKKEVNSNV